MIDASKGFTLVRRFEATPEEIWKAWTDPDSAAQWWHPRGASTPREKVEIDAREGGRYTYTMVNDATGDKVITGGVYREVAPFERLVFTWGHPNGDPDDTPVITVTLEPVHEGTRMTFDLRGVDGSKGDGYFYDGWQEVLFSLGDYLGKSQIAR
ncbi:SRPBCC family protein [Arthrobacter sp. UYCu723]